MNLTTEQLALIEKYCKSGLNEAETKMLMQIPNWKEEVTFYQDFMESMTVLGGERIKNKLLDFENQFQAMERAKRRADILNKLKQKIDLAYNELVELFQPVSAYQLSLNTVSRSDGIVMEKPKNGIDASVGDLAFKFNADIQRVLRLKIENNMREVLIKQKIERGTHEFSVNLEALNNIPGRYYWKLIGAKDVLMGDFFIRKDLMAD